METKLYRNVGGEKQSFLVFHISDNDAIQDLEKFTGGVVEKTDSDQLTLRMRLGNRRFNIGDYVIYLTAQEPFTRVRVTINRVKHSLPKESYLISSPSEFHENFKEVELGNRLQPVG